MIRQSTERRPVMLHSVEAIVGRRHDHGERFSFHPAERRVAEHDGAVVGPVRFEALWMERLNGKDVGQATLTIKLDRFYPGSVGVIRRHIAVPRDS